MIILTGLTDPKRSPVRSVLSSVGVTVQSDAESMAPGVPSSGDPLVKAPGRPEVVVEPVLQEEPEQDSTTSGRPLAGPGSTKPPRPTPR